MKSLVSLEAVNHLVAGSTFTIGKALTVMMCVGLVGIVVPVEAMQGVMG